MSKKKKPKCMVVRTFKNPKAVYRWLKWYLKRVEILEDQLGYKLYCC